MDVFAGHALATIGLFISIIVGVFQIIQYFHQRTARKESSMDKFVKADGIQAELAVIRTAIIRIDIKLETHDEKLSTLASQNAVCINQHENTEDDMRASLRALELIVAKIERINE
jgi:hypothetical protein